jgi:hypothetical protein
MTAAKLAAVAYLVWSVASDLGLVAVVAWHALT